MNGYVLLVEDNRDDETLILMSLRKHNIANRVEVRHDGAEALDFLEKAESLPILMLLDINLPKVDGIEVLRRLRANERTRTTPVVILTSSRQDKDIIASYDFGCNSYVQKPVEFGEFSEAVRTLGIYWLLLNQPPLYAK